MAANGLPIKKANHLLSFFIFEGKIHKKIELSMISISLPKIEYDRMCIKWNTQVIL